MEKTRKTPKKGVSGLGNMIVRFVRHKSDSEEKFFDVIVSRLRYSRQIVIALITGGIYYGMYVCNRGYVVIKRPVRQS